MILAFLKRELLGHASPAPREEPSEEWQKRNTCLFGAERIPTRLIEYDTVLSGGKGTGKTTALTALMRSLIDSRIASGRPFSVHAYSPKPEDLYPWLKETYEPLGYEVRTTNPFMQNSWAWDGAMNLTSGPSINEAVAALIKDDGHEKDPFFKNCSRLAIRGVIQSLAATHPGIWTWRYLAHLMRDSRLFVQVLSRCKETRHILKLFSEKQEVTSANIESTLASELQNFELIAALIDETPDDRRFSIVDAANTPGIIWVWGSDPRYQTCMEPWNGLQWELMGHELLIRGRNSIDTLLFIDEFPQLNGGQKLTIMKRLLEYGRDSNVRTTLAIQTPAQLEGTYGKAEADIILGQTHNVMVFKHSDNIGCEYWSKRLGNIRGFEEKRSVADQLGGSTTGGAQPNSTYSWSHQVTVNREWFDRARVSPSNVGDLIVGSYELGIYGYACVPMSKRMSAETGVPEPIKWLFSMSPEWIRQNVPKRGSCEPYNKSLKPEGSYTLKPFEDWEYDMLDLKRPT
ncbi:MAG: type IV secretion system DNA-binding domain-containing protein [Isosphaeraceae bacterium]